VPRTLATYARVSTGAQNPQRQLDQLREYATAEYADHDVAEYGDSVSGTAASSEEYDRLVEDIDNGVIDRVVVDEISRLSRPDCEVLEFIQYCLVDFHPHVNVGESNGTATAELGYYGFTSLGGISRLESVSPTEVDDAWLSQTAVTAILPSDRRSHG
jgi:hypothetical protein